MQNISQRPATASGTFTIGGDLTVYRLGFGAMRITGEGVWGPPKNKQESIAVLRRALDLGVNFIDTADSYGPNVSEELIAEALYPYPQGLVITTKGGLLRPGPGIWDRDGRPEQLRNALEGSLRRLRVERIDIYQYHRVDPNVPLEDSMSELARLQQEGKIHHVAISNVDADQLAQARKIVPIVTVQNRYNLADHESEQMVDICERENIGFIPWAPLGGPSGGGSPTSNDALSQIAKRHNATPHQIVIAWLLKRSKVMLPIPGTASLKHLEENVASAPIQLSDEEFNSLR